MRRTAGSSNALAFLGLVSCLMLLVNHAHFQIVLLSPVASGSRVSSKVWPKKQIIFAVERREKVKRCGTYPNFQVAVAKAQL
ncbi:MAG TPA: hypothetical protein P5114_01080 [Hyphomicrobiaceae bacterium]|nr:hypothetical protein [Hyphomicrobiaceae bacterium]